MVAVLSPLVVTTYITQVVSEVSGFGHLGLQNASGNSLSCNSDFYSKRLFKYMVYLYLISLVILWGDQFWMIHSGLFNYSGVL